MRGNIVNTLMKITSVRGPSAREFFSPTIEGSTVGMYSSPPSFVPGFHHSIEMHVVIGISDSTRSFVSKLSLQMFLRLARSVLRVDQCLKINRLQFPRFITHAVESPATVVPSSNASAIPSAADVASSMKLSVLKRVPRKKRLSDTSKKSDEHEQYFTISALATADWYDLDRLKQRFVSSSSPFQIVPIAEVIKNVLCVQIPSQRSESTTESEAFIFEDGAVVFWNVQKEHEKLILHEVGDPGAKHGR